MARKIIYKQNGLSGQPDTPTGYKYLGYDGDSLSEKAGATVSAIGGGGTEPYTKVVGYIRLDVPYTDDTTITFYELENTTNGTFTVTRVISGLYQILTDDVNGLTIDKTVAFFSGVIENSGDSLTSMAGTNANYVRLEYRDNTGTYKSIGPAFISVEIRIYN